MSVAAVLVAVAARRGVAEARSGCTFHRENVRCSVWFSLGEVVNVSDEEQSGRSSVDVTCSKGPFNKPWVASSMYSSGHVAAGKKCHPHSRAAIQSRRGGRLDYRKIEIA